jgi:hypothetical protein
MEPSRSRVGGVMGDGRRTTLALGALALVSLVCLLFFLRFRTEAFPEHAIEFAVDRDQAAERAAAFLAELGQPTDGYRTATVFRVDEIAKIYLERELGVQPTTELAGQTDLWHFTTRYFRPLQKEELQVAVAPDGRVVGFRHIVDEAASGPRLSAQEALARADAFRREQMRSTGEPSPGAAAEWRLVEQTSIERPSRLDWRFTWERSEPQLPAGGGEPGILRATMLLQGDQVGEHRQFVKVPEAWQREYARVRSSNSLVQSLDTALGLLPLSLAMMVVFVRRFVRRDLRLRAPVWLALVGGLLASASVLNTLPTAAVGYQTTDAWESFLLQLAINAVLSGLVQGLLTFTFAAAGEALYRQHFSGSMALGPGFTWRGLTSRPGARALAVGALLCTAMAAYQVVYYLVGRAIGIWSPADVRYDDLFSTLVPWLYPAVVGYNAATFEEFSFRLFGIPLLMVPLARLLRSPPAGRWAAIVLTSVVWGFLHSDYPQDPWFARGLEVTLPGIAFAFLMMRFGILASLAVHFAFDALMVAVAISNVSPLPTGVAAYAIAALPLIVAISALVRGRAGGYPAAEPLLNAAQARPSPAATAPPVPRAPWRYRPLPGGLRWAVVGLAAAALALVAVTDLTSPPRQPVVLNRAEAAVRADAALGATGLDPAQYQRVIALESRTEGLARAYLRENGAPQALQTLDDAVPPLLWQARYFRPLERDEYRVLLRPGAAPDEPAFAIVYDLAETSPGARLPLAEARRLAETRLAETPGWAAGGWTIVDEGTTERPNRLDHRFVFERTDRPFGPATLRAELTVIGDRVSGYRPFLKLPEEWERARTGMGPKELLGGLIPMALIAWLFGAGVFAFLRLARERELSWRPAVLTGVIFLALSLVEELNGLTTLYLGYPTALPAGTFLMQRLVVSGAVLGMTTMLAGAVAALLVGLWRQGVAPTLMPAAECQRRRAWALDALAVGVGLPLVLVGLVRLADLVGLSAALGSTAGAAGAPTGAATLVPAVAGLTALRLAGLGVGLVVVASLLLHRKTRRARWVLAVALLVPLAAGLSQRTWPDALTMVGLGVVGVLAAAAAARWLLRDNLLAYGVAAITALALLEGRGLLRTVDPWLWGNGLALLMTVALGLLLLWTRARMRPWRLELDSTRG